MYLFVLFAGGTIATDGSHKVTWNGFPVIMVGCTDVAQHFHVAAVALSKFEKTEDYEDTLRSVKAAIAKIWNYELEPLYGMSDHAASIRTAAATVLPCTFWGNCYSHIMVSALLAYFVAAFQFISIHAVDFVTYN